MATRLKVGEIIEALPPVAEPVTRNIAQRLNAVMGEVDYIQKEKKEGMKYTIVSHDKVTGLVRPILHKHGVVYYPRDLKVGQDGNRTEAVFAVRFENIDDRSDFIDVSTVGYGVDSQDKGPGKALSYGVKYALLKVLGLETGDDPDEQQGDEADHRPGAISADQFKRIESMIDQANASKERFCKYFQITALIDLPAARFNDAVAMLQAKIK